ncbi:hypothetical protein [Salinarchaeum laminariae]|uniref:hypothetical protein n=1 Tax=Salinarchaeum laminariae TaxID=869888 RepID=UPI0020BDF18B|nr:hypothetical protein [Salinarchaeum laminariae]
MPSRRTVLATGAAFGGVLAGCISVDSDSSDTSDATLRLERITDRQLADRTIDRYDVSRPVVDDAITADRAITTAPESIPDESVGRRTGGGYYRLSVSESAPRWSEYTVGLAPADDVIDASDGSVPTSIAELPPVDQAVIADAFDSEADGGADHSFEDGPTVELFANHVYDVAEIVRSAIVDGPTDALEHEGSSYAVHVECVRTLPSIATVSAEHVAEDAEEYGELVRSERAIELSGLSAAEREVVEAAIRDEYETGADDETFGSVIDRLQSRGRLSQGGRGSLVRYDDATYELFVWGLEHYRGERA